MSRTGFPVDQKFVSEGILALRKTEGKKSDFFPRVLSPRRVKGVVTKSPDPLSDSTDQEAQ